MTRSIRRMFVALAIGAVLAGCSNKKAEQEAKAKQEQAAKAEADAKKAADDKKAADEAAAKKAEETKAAAADAAATLTLEVEGHDRKSTNLKGKAAKLKGAAKKNADAAIAELNKRRAAATEAITKLAASTEADFAANKTAGKAAVDKVGEGVAALETTVGKK